MPLIIGLEVYTIDDSEISVSPIIKHFETDEDIVVGTAAVNSKALHYEALEPSESEEVFDILSRIVGNKILHTEVVILLHRFFEFGLAYANAEFLSEGGDITQKLFVDALNKVEGSY